MIHSTPTINISKKRKQTGSFPQKLHTLLDDADEQGFQHIVSWLPDGKGFRVHDETYILPFLKIYFNQTKFKSFLRQLQHYGFERIYKGPKKGVCSHKDFVRGQRKLCLFMVRDQDCYSDRVTSLIRSESLPTKLPSYSSKDVLNLKALLCNSSGMLMTSSNNHDNETDSTATNMETKLQESSLGLEKDESVRADFFSGRRFFYV